QVLGVSQAANSRQFLPEDCVIRLRVVEVMLGEVPVVSVCMFGLHDCSSAPWFSFARVELRGSDELRIPATVGTFANPCTPIPNKRWQMNKTSCSNCSSLKSSYAYFMPPATAPA